VAQVEQQPPQAPQPLDMVVAAVVLVVTMAVVRWLVEQDLVELLLLRSSHSNEKMGTNRR
jgi:hypothetical protein